MAEVPARFLRKAWFIILQHYVEKNDQYSDDPSKKTYVGAIEITATNKKCIAEDGEEQAWLSNGFVTKSLTYDYRYDRVYQILRGHKAEVCGSIYSKINGEAKQLGTLVSNKNGKQTAEGGILQDKVHGVLSDYSIASTGDVIFGEKKLEIGIEYAKKILTYAIKALPDLDFNDSRTKQNTGAILNELLNHLSPGTDPDQGEIIKKHQKFWKNGALLKLQHTRWLVYEGTNAVRTDKASYGIAISTLSFGGLYDDYLTCDMYTKKYMPYVEHNISEKTTRLYHQRGLATFDESRTVMYLELHLEDPVFNIPGLSFYTVRIGDKHNLNLLVGFCTFFSRSRDRHLTKRVIFHKYGFEDEHGTVNSIENEGLNKLGHPINSVSDFHDRLTTDLNYSDDLSEFKKIPLQIRKFLNDDRNANRLAIPTRPIYFLDAQYESLSNFLKEHNLLDEDVILNSICGKYVVFYFYSSSNDVPDKKVLRKKIRKDILEITYDENTTRFSAKYVHYSLTGNAYDYTGEVSRNGFSIVIPLINTELPDQRNAEKRHLYLSFSVPKAAENFPVIFKSATILTGVLSGHDEKDRDPISLYIILGKASRILQKETSIEERKIASQFEDMIINRFSENAGHLQITARTV